MMTEPTGGGERKKISRLQDLAALAQCSPATVSRALHDDPRINEQTRSRIWRLAYDVGFPLGKYLGNKPDGTGRIAVVIPRHPNRTRSLRDPFLLEMLAHIGSEARSYGCDLLIHTASPATEDELEAFFGTVGAGGAIVLGQGMMHDALNRLAARRRDFVVWGAVLEDQDYCVVGSDNFGGSCRAAKYLIGMGRRHLAFLGDATGPEMQLRYEGFQSAVRDGDVQSQFIEARMDVDSAEMALERVIASGRCPDAILCVNDVTAIGAMNALAKHRLSVPRDVNIIGYDDIDYCQYVRPRLSTVSQNVMRGARALVSKMMEGNLTARNSEVVMTELILRES